MFAEVELVRNVTVRAQREKLEGSNFKRFIMECLLKNLLKEKATQDNGYYVTVTSLKSIGKGEVNNVSKCVSFPVTFICRTFMPFTGEILNGVVYQVFRRGVLLHCGPSNYVFLSGRKMPTYHYVCGRGVKPAFASSEFATIRRDSVVRFLVLALRWIPKRGCIKKEFVMLASLEGHYSLGLVPDSDEVWLVN